MKVLSKKFKLFIAVTLAVLVVGMSLFGFLNFNQTVDYKNSYEVRVSVEHKAGNAFEVIESATEEYLASKGIKAAEYATQKINEGKVVIYKFEKDVKINEDDLEKFVQAKLDAQPEIKEITATAEYSEVKGYAKFEAGWMLLGLGVGVVVAFIYALIMEKLSGAVACLSVSIISALVYTALMAITRIPAYPAIGSTICLATVLGAVLAIYTVSKCKAEFKKTASAKPDVFAIAEKVMNNELKNYIIFAIAIILAALCVCVFFNAYMAIVGAQIVLASLSALVVAYFGAPLVWALIKGCKKSKKA